MKKFKVKPCKHCSKEFQPVSPCNLYCINCAEEVRAQRVKAYSKKYWEADPRYLGVGRGGSNKKGNGIGHFFRRRKEILKEVRYCERCEKDLINATRYQWCVHHRDHDRNNNADSNFELLCKSCHQIEHNCHLNLEGATTIPKGSTPKQGEAPNNSMS